VWRQDPPVDTDITILTRGTGWKVYGTDYPEARDEPPAEREAPGPGRWVEARHLTAGDVLKAKNGERRIALGTELIVASGERVYNLWLDGPHNYAVGPSGLLVYNKGGQETAAGETSKAAESPVRVYGTLTLENYQGSYPGVRKRSGSPDLAQRLWLPGGLLGRGRSFKVRRIWPMMTGLPCRLCRRSTWNRPYGIPFTRQGTEQYRLVWNNGAHANCGFQL